MKTRTTERDPCPTHTTSANSRPNVHRMGDTASLMRSTTGRDSFTNTPSPASLDVFLYPSNKKVGLSPLCRGGTIPCHPCQSKGPIIGFRRENAWPDFVSPGPVVPFQSACHRCARRPELRQSFRLKTLPSLRATLAPSSCVPAP